MYTKIFDSIEHKLSTEYHQLCLVYMVFFVSGVLIYFSLQERYLFAVVSLSCVGATFFLYSRKRVAFDFLSKAVMAFVLAILVTHLRVNSLLPANNLEKPIKTWVHGIITSVKPTEKGCALILDHVTELGNKDSGVKKIKVNYQGELSEEYSVGDLVKLQAALFPIQKNNIPGSYDFSFFLKFENIDATGYVASKIIKIESAKISFVTKVMSDLRQTIYRRLIQKIGKENGNFEAAILLGQTGGISKDSLSKLRLSGISHILCVSGLHLTMVVFIVYWFARVCLNFSDFFAYNFNIKSIAALLALLASYFYLNLTGNQIAATRAFIMTSCVLMAIILGLRVHPLRCTLFAGVIILIDSPWYIFHPSFQLSFMAVISLIMGYEYYMKHIKTNAGYKKNFLQKILIYISSNLYSSFLAGIMTAPIIISLFYTFPIYSILMNLYAVPVMSFILMPLSLLALVLMPINCENFVLKINSYFIESIIWLTDIVVSLPGSVWYVGHIPKLSVIIFLIGFFWLSIWQTKMRFYGAFVIILSFVMIIYRPTPDFIVDYKSKSVAIFASNGEFEIYSNRISPFNQRYWANWAGQKEAKVFSLKNLAVESKCGRKIVIQYNGEVCQKNDICIDFTNSSPLDRTINIHEKNNGIEVFNISDML